MADIGYTQSYDTVPLFSYFYNKNTKGVVKYHQKKQITEKYENEFFPWINENWYKFTGVQEAGISKERFLDAPFGINRFKGILNFMNDEDWSERLPETREYLKLVNQQRDWTNRFPEVFPILRNL